MDLDATNGKITEVSDDGAFALAGGRFFIGRVLSHVADDEVDSKEEVYELWNKASPGNVVFKFVSLEVMKEREEKRKLASSKWANYDAYAAFWDDIGFRRGWRQPPFEQDDVDHLLLEAAEVAALVLQAHQKKQPEGTAQLIMRGGQCKEWLKDTGYSPESEPQRFVRDLVHQTFRDAGGYTCGLTGETVDAFIDEVSEGREPVRAPEKAEEAPWPEEKETVIAL